MIFVTVGSALPFDRLIEAMDGWTGRNADVEVFAQIGDGKFLPVNMTYKRMITPGEFRAVTERASIIVAHAGMGSVITAAELGKPIVLLPRRAAAKEHTTDHQLHTAGWLRTRPGIFVADSNDEHESQIAAAEKFAQSEQRLAKTAPADFTDRLRAALVGA
jgi:UDP-N-acetylglucosamine transferase subunit ALG13